MSRTHTMVGMSHRGTNSLVASFPTGKELKLEREPNNRVDPRAVRVMADGHHVAYIASRENKMLSEQMDSGTIYHCRYVRMASGGGAAVVEISDVPFEGPAATL